MTVISKNSRYIIQGPMDDENITLFWSNDDGWVERDDATIFELGKMNYLPMETTGIHFIDSLIFISAENINQLKKSK